MNGNIVVQFLAWFATQDYFPEDKYGKVRVFLNKLLLLVLFLLAIISVGFFSSLNDKMNRELNDPYANSVGIYNMGHDLSPDQMKENYPEVAFHRIITLSPAEAINQKNGVLYLNGLSIGADHPFFLQVFKPQNIVQHFSTIAQQDIQQSFLLLSKRGAERLGMNLSDTSFQHHVPAIHFSTIGATDLDSEIPIYGIFHRLPFDNDFILYDDFSIISEKREASETYKQFWDVIIDETRISKETLRKHKIILDSLLSSINPHIETTIPQTEEIIGILSIKFSGKVPLDEILSVIDSINQLIDLTSYKGSYLTIKEETKKNESRLGDLAVYQRWAYFTATFDSLSTRGIYEVIEQLESQYPEFRIDTKAVDTVFFNAMLEKDVNRLKMGTFFLLLLSVVLIYFYDLRFNLYIKREYINYLKISGVNERKFVIYYLMKILWELLIFGVVPFWIMLVLSKSKADLSISYSSSSIDELKFFFLLCLLINGLISILILRQTIKKDFNEVTQ